MLSYKHRFHGLNSLRFVYSKGEVVRGPHFAIKTAPNPKRQQYRAAVVVSRKVNKSAVVRNRIRRRLYEALRLLSDDITGPYDIVINVYSESVADESQDSLSRQLRKQLASAGVLAKRVS